MPAVVRSNQALPYRKPTVHRRATLRAALVLTATTALALSA
ncbi:hypothetical protein [Streptomyces sp. SAI-229]